MEKVTAIVLAAGQGKRMKSSVSKQYMLLKDKPVLYYSLKAFENSLVTDIIVVVGNDEISYVKEEIIKPYGFRKVTHVVEGGSERYLSVLNGLNKIKDSDYVLVHDGARPLIKTNTINTVISEVEEKKACIVGVASKDTVKISTHDGIIDSTPDRNQVYTIQTPQAFEYSILREAYDNLASYQGAMITDDAMIVECLNRYPIYLVQGEYTNIKITTPEDLIFAEAILREHQDFI
ncbi:2-C-methyl-D-erythritol 4-phosphate cytidylyltransferase [Lachnoclostridium phytofermentans]|uniref:2-C-methyl-D-erythritol 4-phosphate cytidylyltransferase n=1 Tax=Lachnoclostridium phytofermentans (strain ATCC 700394 / DSM 18823 / ISDg) TaxID=357809 RepID=ISPD_LACP7|nr:2-C-methyl-D-erythritol 4-phosphate cytidylyltransferase [Lachnoclostridium phytofermentans]A9KSU6.1 RecName: Full=2-C-methyl-D-erythritol 4-phosphate cytidylyltransferase; AltName: Full=4-diphosphocytidyl-2C-methyl-D-erythritol synthase; AltName: Full=MEP cytidylyltransferase; Short=MCT [Lachnoclostridium phytofermentans ISDg]ABX40740.1 2-C-methyl-D-erythritol 4-phosphate cytidylyltransferase [Lachnoclostridium phytofermentans ISDg]